MYKILFEKYFDEKDPSLGTFVKWKPQIQESSFFNFENNNRISIQTCNVSDICRTPFKTRCKKDVVVLTYYLATLKCNVQKNICFQASLSNVYKTGRQMKTAVNWNFPESKKSSSTWSKTRLKMLIMLGRFINVSHTGNSRKPFFRPTPIREGR